MSYQPLQLKYRPKKIEDLVGQEGFSRTFTNSVKSGRIRPAYLFYGPKGTGKTSSARIVAASINCEKGPTITPCGECRNCVDIVKGKSPDVIELDGGDNRSIEDARDIKKEAQHYPINSRYKVFIIDEAHDLTKEAMEALLKTLEEPPENVVFVLCTTEASKLKGTILSRCQDFRFNKLPWNLIAAHLKAVCNVEKVQIDNDTVRVIAKRADGHMRDALKHLDTVITYCGDEPITAALASTALGVVPESLYFDMMDCVIQKKFVEGSLVAQKMVTSGQNMDQVLSGLIDHLRVLLVTKTAEMTGEDYSGLVTLTEEEKKCFQLQRQLMKLEGIDDMMDALLLIHRGLFYNTGPQILFERYLLKAIKAHHRSQKAA
jgi:DNA polymerase-3 subunit gamma/tau